ncbi:VOC family protein [Actinomadura barringtoniae]|uniref:VOC family protein n=1 Tax=Actinomadura barringtoniae TaxID=1427535 RepID=A0A939TFZ8_9ACTN|nr:VOC family protein [Actinomadura barringtoniae]
MTGVSHLSLSVRDRDASVRWYGDVLGFSPFAQVDNDEWLETICVHPAGQPILGFQQHRDATGGSFDHRRTGLDHLAFQVASRSELEEWSAKLAGLGVTQSPIAETEWGPVLCFRDPDGIQLELFAMA